MTETTDDRAPPPAAAPALSQEALSQLAHMIYDVALDNSRWVELIAHIEALTETSDGAGLENAEGLKDLRAHVERAMRISDRLSENRDAGDLGRRLLSSLSLSFQLFDADGRELSQEWVSGEPGEETPDPLAKKPAATGVLPMALRRQYDATRGPLNLSEGAQGTTDDVLLGPDLVRKMGLPPRVDWARLRLTRDPQQIAANLSATYGLTAGRGKFLAAFLKHADLRETASEVGVSYESARTYLKDICQTIGISGQTELVRAALQNPLSVIDADFSPTERASVRRQIERPEGGQMEYFSLGDADGYPIIHYDAMSGVGLDVLRFPEAFEKVLRRLGARLIIPCRPGTFRSSFIRRKSAAGDAEDLGLLCDRLGIDHFAVLSNSLGSVSALHVARAFGARCDRLVLASVHNPKYQEDHGLQGNYLHKISAVIGRRSPLVLRWLIPFLCKSVIQDPGKFADRAIAVADCPHEEAILRSPNLLKSVQMILEERTANGFAGVVQEHRHIGRPLGFDLAELTVPMLLFHGDRDRSSPLEGARAMAEEAPDATLYVLEGMGRSMIKAEWDWLLAAAAGAPFEVPPATRRGPLVDSLAG
ncbi:Pimeloyl-ACP methyl ester carboxylesterase [Pseudooceanicola antarcticus]|uniref:Alpha/beta hydrolase n=1 Tax=Pseudooceanicola antarcticus TaxID=1247613 RepID=A0A285JFA8_9RHOB|nr:alpha/beta hydrolase [Pseudooceanicola antarcticus]PJE31019.1 alpha/beta hydrolase [Pseudooceanicola antarcticus]SNY58952.1 Pimeloyl-ACP methyl ester carboxylesterase [Pseudooceanicola antarcticus]